MRNYLTVQKTVDILNKRYWETNFDQRSKHDGSMCQNGTRKAKMKSAPNHQQDRLLYKSDLSVKLMSGDDTCKTNSCILSSYIANIYCSTFSNKEQISGWKSKFCIMTNCLSKQNFSKASKHSLYLPDLSLCDIFKFSKLKTLRATRWQYWKDFGKMISSDVSRYGRDTRNFEGNCIH